MEKVPQGKWDHQVKVGTDDDREKIRQCHQLLSQNYKIDTMGRATSYLRMSRHFSQNVLDVSRLKRVIDNFSEK